MNKVAILGAGSFGVALSILLARKGKRVTVWSALSWEVNKLYSTRKHPNLEGAQIPDTVDFTADLEAAVSGAQFIVFAVPSPFVRTTANKVAPLLQAGQIIVSAVKGLEAESLLTMSDVIADEVKGEGVHYVALSGPTHAEEVALGLPTVIVAAGKEDAAKAVWRLFSSESMRVYISEDKLGVELCGAIKNIIALASGIAAGLGLGDNTKAALITRGAAEMARLGRKMGCKQNTFTGVAGIGDLIVTATSEHSRNFRCGKLIGKGVPPERAVAEVGMVVEGINVLPAAMRLLEKYKVDMPIVKTVSAIVFEQLPPLAAVKTLMNRGR